MPIHASRLSRVAVAAWAGCTAVLVFTADAARAQGAPPTYEQLVKEGSVLAQRLCSSCHLVDNRSDATANVGVPTLRAVANLPGQTATRIRNVLINPHPPMPDVRLSNPEIDRILAYIDSLRTKDAGPPLIPRTSPGAKPVYPDPS